LSTEPVHLKEAVDCVVKVAVGWRQHISTSNKPRAAPAAAATILKQFRSTSKDETIVATEKVKDQITKGDVIHEEKE
jgi:hypothetical protein